VLVFWRAAVAQRRQMENMQELAVRLGLEFCPTNASNSAPCLTGKFRGKQMDIFIHVTGAGKSRRYWGVFSVRTSAWESLTFTLQKQGLGAKLSELLGAREITVGDPAFDAAWFGETNQPDFFRAALLPEVREKLMAVRRAGAEGKFELVNGAIKYVERNRFDQDEGVELFVMLAEVIDDLAEIAATAVSTPRSG